jgi:hypothetical protein
MLVPLTILQTELLSHPVILTAVGFGPSTPRSQLRTLARATATIAENKNANLNIFRCFRLNQLKKTGDSVQIFLDFIVAQRMLENDFMIFNKTGGKAGADEESSDKIAQFVARWFD